MNVHQDEHNKLDRFQKNHKYDILTFCVFNDVYLIWEKKIHIISVKRHFFYFLVTEI